MLYGNKNKREDTFLHLERIIILIQMPNKMLIIPPSNMDYINKLYKNTDFVVQYIHKYQIKEESQLQKATKASAVSWGFLLLKQISSLAWIP